MSTEASVGYRFAKALLARSEQLDDLREEIVRRWGRKALIAVAFCIASGRAFPVLKYALGHGHSCQRIEIGGATLAPHKLAHA
jgi:hypothetical protein